MYAWPITVVLIAGATTALVFRAPFRDPRFRRGLKLLLISYAIPVVIIVIGAVLRYDGPRAPAYVEPPVWRGIVLWSAILVHIAVLVAGVIFMRGARIRAAAVVLPGIWASLSSGFVAGIAIAGVGP